MHLIDVSRKALEPLQRTKVSILSPLRYPGSKRRLAGYVAQALEANNLSPALFVEPFAGGASVALQLVSNGAVTKIGLIERDPLVAAFWKTAFFDADWLVKQIETQEVTMDKWREYKEGMPAGTRERAVACLFLNRTSFSGILAPGAGPIGGYEQKSEYKLDCRFPRQTLMRRVRQLEALRGKVAFVHEMSWEDGMKAVRQEQQRGALPADVFYYFDPPFFEKADRLYTHYFTAVDHLRLKDTVVELQTPWLLSYDNLAMVKGTYGDLEAGSTHVEVIYSTSANGGNRVASEVILTNLASLPSETRLWRFSKERKMRASIQLPRPTVNHRAGVVPDKALVGLR